MKERFYPYSAMLLAVIFCGIICACFNTMSTVVSVLICFLCGATIAAVCLFTKHRENINEGHDSIWLNCLFLLENYEVTDKNIDIITHFLANASRKVNTPPPIHYSSKLEKLLEDKNIPNKYFSTDDSWIIFYEAFGLGMITFSVTGLLSSAIRYFSSDNPLSVMFWVSLGLLLLGVFICLAMVEDIDKHKVISIVSGAIFAILAVCVVCVSGYRADAIEKRCDDITIAITEKGDGEITELYKIGFVSDFKMSVFNEKTKDIVRLTGEMNIYNVKGELLNGSFITLYEEIPSKATKEILIELETGYDDKAIELYYSNADDLYITFKITDIAFDDGKSEEYPDSKLMDILPVSKKEESADRISSVEAKYLEAIGLYDSKEYVKAVEAFLDILYYKQSGEYIMLCEEAAVTEAKKAIYEEAKVLMNAQKYSEAIRKFSEIIDYKDSASKIEKCEEMLKKIELENKYQQAQELYNKKEYAKAYAEFASIINYEDSQKYMRSILNDVNKLAQNYADGGDYDVAYNLLKSIGYSSSEYSPNYSELMHACAAITSGNYKTAISCGIVKIILPEGITAIENNKFKDCEKLVEIVIPESVTSIGDSAFSGCVGLEKLVLPQSVKHIGVGAFQNCDSLEKLILPASLESISLYGFNSIDGEIYYEGTVEQWNAIRKTGPVSSTDKTIYCSDGKINP